MADEEGGGGNPLNDLLFLVGALAVLIALWFVGGGSKKADLRGIFLAPPPPIGHGGAYGPQIGSTTNNQ